MLRILRIFLFGLVLALGMTQVSATVVKETESCVTFNQVCHDSIHKRVEHNIDCPDQLSCMVHCTLCAAWFASPNKKLPESLVAQYSLLDSSAVPSFLSQPNIPPPKSISFS